MKSYHWTEFQFRSDFTTFFLSFRSHRIKRRQNFDEEGRSKIKPGKMANKFNFHMGGLSPSLTSSNQSTPTGPDDATAFNYPPVGAVSFRFPPKFLFDPDPFRFLNFLIFFPVCVRLRLEQLLCCHEYEL